ncbi:hypothetical protein O4J56_10275 [Nocardiopsis sp. RSe5-2]|uniref:Immunity protein Imm1 n=1 Tax=Nocardiopsis endophytica TaxID=3018445 RepID=A0ABT4U250_9ACTN|nr:hypothetical protein [Nocardiopsis endophytica]MDA2811022.1 hypothetical protein [Nocardiopsis endophytica]
MVETWVIEDGGGAPVAADTVEDVLRERIAQGRFDALLAGSSGRSLVFVTNGVRAMTVLLGEDGDPGEHAADPGAEGTSGGFVLSNGQHDAYPDEDTVPLDEAFRIIGRILRDGSWPSDAPRVVDR